MKRWLIGIAIDLLKWIREPLFRLYQAIYRLRLRSMYLLVRLQFKYHDLDRPRRDARAGKNTG